LFLARFATGVKREPPFIGARVQRAAISLAD
jgi:hypothetical protein